ncbi:hypothetical protein MML48_3g00007082 [Holotrichia oblita]|uniref:Uncharacterized protein n=1 Tax=Holotrichia oblita TaxID=644536 RepID=A0ACB9TH05_HOLOL|nr:hypothetical protein MML48_3g00007082 [Holotrichia oblita]
MIRYTENLILLKEQFGFCEGLSTDSQIFRVTNAARHSLKARDWLECIGKEWLMSFMKRHADLSLQKPESTSLSRSMAFNKPVIDDFFNKYGSVLESFKFTPDKIWNLDETGIAIVMRPVKIFSTKGKKQVGSPTGSIAIGNTSGWMTSELLPEFPHIKSVIYSHYLANVAIEKDANRFVNNQCALEYYWDDPTD